MKAPSSIRRRGITLLEVLISIGILAVGLSSVVALIPAGKSESSKAVMLDRGATLAMNVLDDAVTFGLTRPSSISFPATAANTLVTFDLLNVTSGSCVWISGTASVPVTGTIKPKGVFASGTDSGSGGELLLGSLLQGRDDLIYTAPASDDDPPLNALANGARAYLGRTSALVSVAPISGTFTPGAVAKVTAVVFHNRNLADSSDAIVSGTLNALNDPVGTVRPPSTLPTDRSLKDIIRPGTVVYCPSSPPHQVWYQVAMASVDDSAGIVYVTFVGDAQPPAGTDIRVQIALDSIGLAERIVTLEGSGPYAQ
jgi:type II secretory pathway pseudopilin PulG